MEALILVVVAIIIGILITLVVMKVVGLYRKKQQSKDPKPKKEPEKNATAKDDEPKDVKEKPKWMTVKVSMKQTTYERLKNYLAYQGAFRTVETGKICEHTPDEAINELIILYIQSVKIYGKASAKELNNQIKKARDEVAKEEAKND